MHRTAKALLTVLLPGIMTLSLAAQEQMDQVPACSEPEALQFDFWVGTWNLTWGDSGMGTNVITKELGGCVVEENFTTGGDNPFIGRSVSVYNKNTKQWHQTWVDNSGGYLDFTGGMEDDKMILSRQARPAGKDPFLQRMVFYNITEDSLDWNWEKSIDSGKTWENLWHIRYVRAK